ncbi:MAG: PhnD/SsuA/transferrin family substrate-binding protein [Granulosicoccus sp.]|nr:PhnD/SsuA/transferrin family substrate-binding protein [Granulosicoccus sp.]
MIASLPMYDWPEVQSATDRWWHYLKTSFLQNGIGAPDSVCRHLDNFDVWLSPELLLSQTCGLPYATRLRDCVSLIGTPDYGIEGCPAGYYCSALVIRAGDDRTRLQEFRHSRWACNARNSQSGYQAMVQAVADVSDPLGFFKARQMTNSHRNSIRQVAASHADIAAIDWVSWRLARKYESAAKQLRVLQRTHPMPGLPYICHRSQDAMLACDVVENALEQADREVKSALSIQSFWRSEPGDYNVIAERMDSADYH